jgi:neutral ceramidase
MWPGQYRIVHYGTTRNLDGTLKAFTGTTREFTVS